MAYAHPKFFTISYGHRFPLEAQWTKQRQASDTFTLPWNWADLRQTTQKSYVELVAPNDVIQALFPSEGREEEEAFIMDEDVPLLLANVRASIMQLQPQLAVKTCCVLLSSGDMVHVERCLSVIATVAALDAEPLYGFSVIVWLKLALQLKRRSGVGFSHISSHVTEFVLGYVYDLATCVTRDVVPSSANEEVKASCDVQFRRLRGSNNNDALTTVYSIAIHASTVERTTMSYNRSIDKRRLFQAAQLWVDRIAVRSLHVSAACLTEDSHHEKRRCKAVELVAAPVAKIEMSSDDILVEAVTLKWKPKLVEHLLEFSPTIYDHVSHVLERYEVPLASAYEYCFRAIKTYFNDVTTKIPRHATSNDDIGDPVVHEVWEAIKTSFISGARAHITATFASFQQQQQQQI